MKALVKAEAGPGLALRDEPVPEIGPDDVLVRIRKTSICGTDVHIWNWDEWASKTIPVPMIIGHEWCGEIARVGERVGRRLEVGQRVSGEGHLVGMRSRMSRAGRFHLDPDTRGVGVHVPGAFAEYLRLPAFNTVALPDDIDDELGAILDPLGNAVHTALSFDLVGEDVLVTGAGPIGIMGALVAQKVGARKVAITDINPVRLKLARDMGIDAETLASGLRTFQRSNPSSASAFVFAREISMTGTLERRRPVGVGVVPLPAALAAWRRSSSAVKRRSIAARAFSRCASASGVSYSSVARRCRDGWTRGGSPACLR